MTELSEQDRLDLAKGRMDRLTSRLAWRVSRQGQRVEALEEAARLVAAACDVLEPSAMERP